MDDHADVKRSNKVKEAVPQQAPGKGTEVFKDKQRKTTSAIGTTVSKRRQKGAMSFDEDELASLRRNRKAALTASLSLESTDDSKLEVPSVMNNGEESIEQDDGESEISSMSLADITTDSEVDVGRISQKDPKTIFYSLEKPDTLDPKEESGDNKEDLKRNNHENSNMIFYALEKPDTLDPNEELHSDTKFDGRKAKSLRTIGRMRTASKDDFNLLEKPEEVAKEDLLMSADIAKRKTRKFQSFPSLKNIRPTLKPARKSESLRERRPQRKLQQRALIPRTDKILGRKGESKKSERVLKSDRASKSGAALRVGLRASTPKVMPNRKTGDSPKEFSSPKKDVAIANDSPKGDLSIRTKLLQRSEELPRTTTTQLIDSSPQKSTSKTFDPTLPQSKAAKKSSSISAISVTERLDEPPRSHYKFVYVRVNLTQKQLDVNLTENLVIVFINIDSPLFYHLVVGDQITEVDGLVPNDLKEFLKMVESASDEYQITFGVIRPWNVRPPTPKRMAHVYAVKKHCYLIVELPLIRKLPAGYEFQSSRGRLHFTKVEPQTMGAFAFLVVDRIIDVDSDIIPNRVNVVALKNRIRAVQERDGYCTFLIERPSSLHHITNPSCVAMKAPTGDGDVVMADDAVEIGAREAFKHTFVKDKHRNTSVYRPTMKDINNSDSLQLLTAVESDTEVRRRPSKKRKRTLKIGKNPKEKAIPSDVKRGTHLSKISESSLKRLVTRFISKTFTR